MPGLILQLLVFGKIIHQCPECVVCPQGKLGGCTVISCGVTLNYTTYYLNLRKHWRKLQDGCFVGVSEMDQTCHDNCNFTVYCDSELYHDIDCYDNIWKFLRKFQKQSIAKITRWECLFLANPLNYIPENPTFL